MTVDAQGTRHGAAALAVVVYSTNSRPPPEMPHTNQRSDASRAWLDK
jgi:hypothetical protein